MSELHDRAPTHSMAEVGDLWRRRGLHDSGLQQQRQVSIWRQRQGTMQEHCAQAMLMPLDDASSPAATCISAQLPTQHPPPIHPAADAAHCGGGAWGPAGVAVLVF